MNTNADIKWEHGLRGMGTLCQCEICRPHREMRTAEYPQNENYLHGGAGVRKDSVSITMNYGEWHKTYPIGNDLWHEIHLLVSGRDKSDTVIVDARIKG
jgi:hypothetical protein